ncbi:hypothetical protein PGDDIFCJ_00082 [Thermus phage YS40_Isch]|nr:hypothetical protein PGDDIFCJ_00082 [Thermus phage YS40_Isch]
MGTFYSVTGPITTEKDYDVVKRVPEGFVLYHKDYPTTFVFFEGQVIKPKNGVIVNQPDSNWILEEYEKYAQKYQVAQGQQVYESYREENFQESEKEEESNYVEEFVEKLNESVFDIDASEGNLIELNNILGIDENWEVLREFTPVSGFFTLMTSLAIGFLLEKGYLEKYDLIGQEDITFVFKQKGVFEELKKFLSNYLHDISDGALNVLTYLVVSKYNGVQIDVDANWFLSFYNLYKDRLKGIYFSKARIDLYDVERNLIYALSPKALIELTVEEIMSKKSLVKVMLDINNFLQRNLYGFDLSSPENIKNYLSSFFEVLLEVTPRSDKAILAPLTIQKTFKEFVNSKGEVILSALALFASLDKSSEEGSYFKLKELIAESMENLSALEEAYDSSNDVEIAVHEARYKESLNKLLDFATEQVVSFSSKDPILKEDDVHSLTLFLSFFLPSEHSYKETFLEHVFSEEINLLSENIPASTYIRRFFLDPYKDSDVASNLADFFADAKIATLISPELAKYTDTSILAREIQFDPEGIKEMLKNDNLYRILETFSQRKPSEDIPELRYVVDIINTLLSRYHNKSESLITEKVFPIIKAIIEKYENSPEKLFEVADFVKGFVEFLTDISTKRLPYVAEPNNLSAIGAVADFTDYMIYAYDKVIEKELSSSGEKKLMYRIAATNLLTYLANPSTLAEYFKVTSGEHFESIIKSYQNITNLLSKISSISVEQKADILKGIENVVSSINKMLNDIDKNKRITKRTIASLESMMYYLEHFIREDLMYFVGNDKSVLETFSKEISEIQKEYKKVYTSLFAMRNNLMANSLIGIFEKEKPEKFPVFLTSRYKAIIVDAMRRLVENSDLIYTEKEEKNLLSLYSVDESGIIDKNKKLDFVRIVNSSGKPALRVRIPSSEFSTKKNSEHFYELVHIEEMKEFFFEKTLEELLDKNPETYGLLEILPKELALRSLDHTFLYQINDPNFLSPSDLQAMTLAFIGRGGAYFLPKDSYSRRKALEGFVSSKVSELRKALSSKEKMRTLDKLRLSLQNFEVVDYTTNDKIRGLELSAKVRIGKNVYKVSVRDLGFHVYMHALVEYLHSIGKSEEEIIEELDSFNNFLTDAQGDLKERLTLNKFFKWFNNRIDKNAFVKFLIKSAIELSTEGKSSVALSNEDSIRTSPPPPESVNAQGLGESLVGYHSPFDTPMSSLVFSKMLEKAKPLLDEDWFNFVKELSEKYINIVINPNGWYYALGNTININPIAYLLTKQLPRPSINMMLRGIEGAATLKKRTFDTLHDYKKEITTQNKEESIYTRIVQAFTSTLIHEVGHALANAYHQIKDLVRGKEDEVDTHISEEDDVKIDINDTIENIIERESERERFDPREIQEMSKEIPDFITLTFLKYQRPRIVEFTKRAVDELGLDKNLLDRIQITSTNLNSDLQVLYSNYYKFLEDAQKKISENGEEFERKLDEMMKEYEIMNFYSFFNIIEVPSTALEFYFLYGEEEFKNRYPTYYPMIKRLIEDYKLALEKEKEDETK